MPEGRLIGSAQLCQEALIVVSQGAVRLHVGDRPLLCLPGQSGHEEGHALSLSGEARGLKDHEPVHLHQEASQLARVSREGLRQRGGGRGHGPGPARGDGGDGRGDLQRPGDARPSAQQGQLGHHALQHVGEVGLLGAQGGRLPPQRRVGEAQGGQGVDHVIHLGSAGRSRGRTLRLGHLRLHHADPKLRWLGAAGTRDAEVGHP